MAYPLAFPADIQPSSESWTLENADITGGVSLAGSEKVISSGTSRWRARLTYELYREDILPFRAFIMGLRGRAGTMTIGPADLVGMPEPGTQDAGLIEIGLLSYQTDYPILDGAPATLTADAHMGSNTLSLQMVPGRKPQPGNYISIFGKRLHVLTSVSGSGPFICSIEPGLRDDTPAGTFIWFQSPVCLMRQATPLDPGGLTVSAATFTTSVTLDLVEP